MLDRIGQVGVAAFDAGGLKRAIQKSAGWADERPPGAILLITGDLTDEHHARFARTFAEDHLGGRLPKWAAAAARGRCLRGEKRMLLGQKLRCRPLPRSHPCSAVDPTTVNRFHDLCQQIGWPALLARRLLRVCHAARVHRAHPRYLIGVRSRLVGAREPVLVGGAHTPVVRERPVLAYQREGDGLTLMIV
jgi:hypothetical protein